MTKLPPTEPVPRMRPTRPSTLVAAFVGAALVAWLLVTRFYGAIPELPWLPLFTVALLVVAEGVTAQATHRRIARRPGTEPADPLVVARLAALAKASSLTGALLGGVYGGVTLFLLAQRHQLAAATHDLPVAVGGLVVCAALVGTALWLEWACRIPPGSKGSADPTA
jgi:uncharacterized protein (DUF983 family)